MFKGFVAFIQGLYFLRVFDRVYGMCLWAFVGFIIVFDGIYKILTLNLKKQNKNMELQWRL